jgi:hypothetical protein
MGNFLLLLAIICAGGSYTLYTASEAVTANSFTGDVPG